MAVRRYGPGQYGIWARPVQNMGRAGTNLVKLSLTVPRFKCKHGKWGYGPGRYEFSETVPGFT